MLPDGEFPSENTLTMNVGYGILEDLKSVYPDTIAIVPSRTAEDDYGYDMAADWNWWKSVALQFKHPFASGGSNAGSGDYLKYRVDIEQFAGIVEDYGLRAAFYTLPPITDRDGLHTEPDKTLFLDVIGLADEAYSNPSRLDNRDDRDHGRIVVRDHLCNRRYCPGSSSIHLSTENGYTAVPSDHIYYWEDLRVGLLFGDIGRQSATFRGGAAVATDGGEGPDDDEFQNEERDYKRPPEVIIRGNRSPEDRDDIEPRGIR